MDLTGTGLETVLYQYRHAALETSHNLFLQIFTVEIYLVSNLAAFEKNKILISKNVLTICQEYSQSHYIFTTCLVILQSAVSFPDIILVAKQLHTSVCPSVTEILFWAIVLEVLIGPPIFIIFAQAVGVAVGRRSGGGLART